jgi:hypothetical protein
MVMLFTSSSRPPYSRGKIIRKEIINGDSKEIYSEENNSTGMVLMKNYNENHPVRKILQVTILRE